MCDFYLARKSPCVGGALEWGGAGPLCRHEEGVGHPAAHGVGEGVATARGKHQISAPWLAWAGCTGAACSAPEGGGHLPGHSNDPASHTWPRASWGGKAGGVGVSSGQPVPASAAPIPVEGHQGEQERPEPAWPLGSTCLELDFRRMRLGFGVWMVLSSVHPCGASHTNTHPKCNGMLNCSTLFSP